MQQIQGLRFSPSSFCESVSYRIKKEENPNYVENKTKISGPEQGLVNNIPLKDIIDEYRSERKMVTRNKKTKTETFVEMECLEERSDNHDVFGSKILLLIQESNEKQEIMLKDISNIKSTLLPNYRDRIEDSTIFNERDQEYEFKIQIEKYNDDMKKDDNEKELHNQLFVRNSYEFYCEILNTTSVDKLFMIYLDGESIRTTKRIKEKFQNNDDTLHCIIVNNTNIAIKMRESIYENEFKNVSLELNTIHNFLKGNEIRKCNFIFSVWFDSTETYSAIKAYFTQFLKSKKSFNPSGVIVGLTWCNSRGLGKKNDCEENIEELQQISKKHGYCYTKLEKMEFFYKKYRNMVFVLGKLFNKN